MRVRVWIAIAGLTAAIGCGGSSEATRAGTGGAAGSAGALSANGGNVSSGGSAAGALERGGEPGTGGSSVAGSAAGGEPSGGTAQGGAAGASVAGKGGMGSAGKGGSAGAGGGSGCTETTPTKLGTCSYIVRTCPTYAIVHESSETISVNCETVGKCESAIAYITERCAGGAGGSGGANGTGGLHSGGAAGQPTSSTCDYGAACCLLSTHGPCVSDGDPWPANTVACDVTCGPVGGKIQGRCSSSGEPLCLGGNGCWMCVK
jgi:hypothetical protein